MNALLCSALLGIASWYGGDHAGRLTASGEVFDPAALTAASWYFDLGAVVTVTNPENGKRVQVRINDRGPAKRLGRLIDLSEAGFQAIGHLDRGILTVRVEEKNKEEGKWKNEEQDQSKIDRGAEKQSGAEPPNDALPREGNLKCAPPK